MKECQGRLSSGCKYEQWPGWESVYHYSSTKTLLTPVQLFGDGKFYILLAASFFMV